MDILTFIEEFEPCQEARGFLDDCNSLEDAWDMCENPHWIMWSIASIVGTPAARVILFDAIGDTLSAKEHELMSDFIKNGLPGPCLAYPLTDRSETFITILKYVTTPEVCRHTLCKRVRAHITLKELLDRYEERMNDE